MDEDKKKRILEARNNFINELAEIILEKEETKKLKELLHPISVKLTLDEIPSWQEFYSRKVFKKELLNEIVEENNKINMDWESYSLRNSLSTEDFNRSKVFLKSS